MPEQGHHAATLRQLLQLIDAEPDRFMEADEALEDALLEARNHDLSPFWAAYHLLQHEAMFAAEWADIFDLVDDLRAVAANWQADVFFGVQESDDEPLVFETEPRLERRVLACSASAQISPASAARRPCSGRPARPKGMREPTDHAAATGRASPPRATTSPRPQRDQRCICWTRLTALTGSRAHSDMTPDT